MTDSVDFVEETPKDTLNSPKVHDVQPVLPVSVNTANFNYVMNAIKKTADGKRLDSTDVLTLVYTAMRLMKDLPKLTDKQEEDLIHAVMLELLHQSDLSENQRDVLLLVVDNLLPTVLSETKKFTTFIKARSFYKKLLRHFRKH
jgi:hypothetical protein